MALVENGKFTIPLFHGTTGLFIESIEESGLGGKDPLLKLGAKELMCDLFEIAEEQHWLDDKWLENKKIIQATVNQQKIGDNLNFKHGESYLAYSPEVAVKYAVENPFGCEYLTYLRSLIGILVCREVEGLKEMFNDRPVVKVLETFHDPYIITLNNVELDNVETETGTDMMKQLEEIEELMEAGKMGLQSFKLKNPIYKEDLKITKIGYWNLENGNFVKEEGEFAEII